MIEEVCFEKTLGGVLSLSITYAQIPTEILKLEILHIFQTIWSQIDPPGVLNNVKKQSYMVAEAGGHRGGVRVSHRPSHRRWERG